MIKTLFQSDRILYKRFTLTIYLYILQIELLLEWNPLLLKLLNFLFFSKSHALTVVWLQACMIIPIGLHFVRDIHAYPYIYAYTCSICIHKLDHSINKACLFLLMYFYKSGETKFHLNQREIIEKVCI